ncbi:hypothetical protein ACMYSO_05895 [Klebsiella sp. B345]|uniref:hypothetical protein n=1 Tax=Klebsiella sp. B345 TaxID=2755398 RepID=UPI003DA7C567
MGDSLSFFLDIYSGGELLPLKYWSNDVNPKENSFAINVKGRKIVYAIYSRNDSYLERKEYYIVAGNINIRDAMIYCSNGVVGKYSGYTKNGQNLVLKFDKNIIKNMCGDSPIYYVVLQY